MFSNEDIAHLVETARLDITKSYILWPGGKMSLQKFYGNHLTMLPIYPILCAAMPTFNEKYTKISFQDALQINAMIGHAIANRPQAPESPFSPLQEALLQTHIPCVEWETGECFLWAKNDRRISDMSHKIFTQKFKGKARIAIDEMAVISEVVFDPYKGTQTYWETTKEGQPLRILNAFRPPVWYTQDVTKDQAAALPEKYPQLFAQYVKALFPVPQHQSIFLDWLSVALFSRATSMLLLRGARGNGKTIFKQLLFHLIGNFHEALAGISLDFNADLKNKRIIGIDDNQNIGTFKGAMLRKSLTNATVSYNEKNVQTKMSSKQHASFIICSNPADAFYVRHDERKLVCPTLSTVRMETWATPEIFRWLEAFETTENLTSATHIEFLRQIGVALLGRFVRRNPSPAIELKGGVFWDDVRRSLTSFRRHLLDALLVTPPQEGLDFDIEREEYAMISKGSGGKLEHWHTIKTWLEQDMSWRGHQLVGQIDEKEKRIYVNPRAYAA